MISEETKQQLILTLLGLDKKEQQINKCSMIGKICMIRTRSAGVHFGRLLEKDGAECLIGESRRVFYWAQACSLSQLATDGSLDNKACKISVPVNKIILTEVIEIIPMTEKAVVNLTEHVWKK